MLAVLRSAQASLAVPFDLNVDFLFLGSNTVIQVGQGRDKPFLLQCGCPQLMGEPSAYALLAVTPLPVCHELLTPPGDLVWK